MNATQEGLCDGQFNGGGRFQGRQGNGHDPNKGKPDIITNNDKKHAKLRVKQGEDFAKVFHKN